MILCPQSRFNNWGFLFLPVALVLGAVGALHQAPSPQAPDPGEDLRRAIEGARSERGYRFTFKTHVDMPPGDPMESEGFGIMVNPLDFLALQFEGTGGMRKCFLRRGERVLSWHPFLTQWVNAEPNEAQGMASPDTVLAILLRHVTGAAAATRWECSDHSVNAYVRVGFPRVPTWVRLEFGQEGAAPLLTDLGFHPEDIDWPRTSLCLTSGLAGDRVQGVLAYGRVRLMPAPERQLDELVYHASIRVEQYGGDLTPSLTFEGQPVDVPAGLRELGLSPADFR